MRMKNTNTQNKNKQITTEINSLIVSVMVIVMTKNGRRRMVEIFHYPMELGWNNSTLECCAEYSLFTLI